MQVLQVGAGIDGEGENIFDGDRRFRGIGECLIDNAVGARAGKWIDAIDMRPDPAKVCTVGSAFGLVNIEHVVANGGIVIATQQRSRVDGNREKGQRPVALISIGIYLNGIHDGRYSRIQRIKSRNVSAAAGAETNILCAGPEKCCSVNIALKRDATHRHVIAIYLIRNGINFRSWIDGYANRLRIEAGIDVERKQVGDLHRQVGVVGQCFIDKIGVSRTGRIADAWN